MNRRLSTQLLVIVLCIGLTACARIGPESIKSGRLSYVEALSTTNEQQILLAVVRNRFNQHGMQLAVSSITANIRIAASSSIQAGFGDSDNYDGNLVPFGAGVQYEENPTISYVPVEGEAYMRQIMQPLPLSRVTLLAGSLTQPAYVYELLFARVNGLRNPVFDTNGGAGDGYARFVSLMVDLHQLEAVRWVIETDNSASLVIDRALGDAGQISDELLDILELEDPSPRSEFLVVPATLSLDGRPDNTLGITTRTMWNLVEIMSAAVEVPGDAPGAETATDYPSPAGSAGRLRIRHSTDEPEGVSLAAPYRGTWYFIDDDDAYTKRVFRLLVGLWNGAMAEGRESTAPVLTVPVSR